MQKSECQPKFADEGGVRLNFLWLMHASICYLIKIFVFALAAAIITSTAASAQSVYRQGYTAQSGTYVAPHYQSAPNGISIG